MKHLFVLLIFISLKNGLLAQVTDSTRTDSTHVNNMTNNMNNSSTNSSTNTMNATSDSTGNMNTPSAPNPSANSSTNTMNATSDSTGNMPAHNPNSMNSSTTTTSPAMANPMNEKGMAGYAALPVLESYVPNDIVSKIKDKYGSTLYDITAVRSAPPKDSSMSMNMNMNADSAASRNMSQDSAANMNMKQNLSAAIPVQYNYAVRTIKGGSAQTEWVGSDGTSAVTPGELNKQ